MEELVGRFDSKTEDFTEERSLEFWFEGSRAGSDFIHDSSFFFLSSHFNWSSSRKHCESNVV